MPAEIRELAAFQRTMLRALHGDPAAFAATAAAIEDDGLAPAKRLYLHLNTIRRGLTGVLREAYPATARLLGEARFEALAGAFLRAEPPCRPQLSGYGAGFERFLAGPGGLAEPLTGVARLDWAAQEAYFAADAEALTAAALAELPEAAHAGLRLAPVPSARLVPLPAAQAWRRWREAAAGGAVVPVEPCRPGGGPPAAVLAWRRPDLAVAARPLTAGELLCLAALAAGESLLAAAAGAQESAELDLGTLLTDCLAGGVFRAGPSGGAPARAAFPTAKE